MSKGTIAVWHKDGEIMDSGIIGKVYRNGEVVDTGGKWEHITITYESKYPLRGIIDHYKAYDKALTHKEVEDLYFDNIEPK